MTLPLRPSCRDQSPHRRLYRRQGTPALNDHPPVCCGLVRRPSLEPPRCPGAYSNMFIAIFASNRPATPVIVSRVQAGRYSPFLSTVTTKPAALPAPVKPAGQPLNTKFLPPWKAISPHAERSRMPSPAASLYHQVRCRVTNDDPAGARIDGWRGCCTRASVGSKRRRQSPTMVTRTSGWLRRCAEVATYIQLACIINGAMVMYQSVRNCDPAMMRSITLASLQPMVRKTVTTGVAHACRSGALMNNIQTADPCNYRFPALSLVTCASYIENSSISALPRQLTPLLPLLCR